VIRVAFKDPKSITEAGVETGAKKAKLSWDKALVAGFLAGAYIAFGAMVAISVSSGLDPKTWGTLPTLFAGSVFALGLVLVVIAGADLLTCNMALVPLAAFRGRTAIFVALGYWYLYGRDEETPARAGRVDNGDRAVSEDRETARSGA
jgi:formate/nitrite transporter FocA (FNT family)